MYLHILELTSSRRQHAVLYVATISLLTRVRLNEAQEKSGGLFFRMIALTGGAMNTLSCKKYSL